MSDTIRALKIDATARSITEITLPTRPGNPAEFYGTQVPLDALYEALGCRTIEIHTMPDGKNQMVLDEEALLTDPPPTHFWQWGDDCAPIARVGLITGHDFETDAWSDATITVQEAEVMVRWTRRIVRGHTFETKTVGDIAHIKVGLVAPIVEEK